MVRFPGPFPFSLQLSAAVPDVGVAVTVEIEESLATDVVTVVAGARLVGGETLNALTGLLKLLAAVDFYVNKKNMQLKAAVDFFL